MHDLDITHDASRQSWVPSAQGHRDFPLQNLPLGVVAEADRRFAVVAIGDEVLSLPGLLDAGLLQGDAALAAEAASDGRLNALLALGEGPRRALRRQIHALLSEGASERPRVEALLRPAASCSFALPASVGDYTDFYVGIHHAENVGRLFRPDNPLLPNYKHLPIGYHGRASSVVISGTPVKRPSGQIVVPGTDGPRYEPSRRLDYELELGLWVGPGNNLGETVPIGSASSHIAGISLLNDWSARDIQAWEYQPLGPFLAKSFATSISPWIVTPEALAPFRIPHSARQAGDPALLPYLADPRDQARGAFDIALDVHLLTPAMRMSGDAPFSLARSNARHMYWTAAQIVTQHASNGCNLRPGDLIGTGTISGPDRASCGALIETTRGGKEPVRLPNGEERAFLQDGDEVILTGRCMRDGFAPIGFGECRGTILPASIGLARAE